MVQLTVRLVVAAERVDDLVGTLQWAVMRPAQQLRGCRFAQVYHCASDRRRVEYVEEWNELRELRDECRSERFTRLLEVMEMAAEAPDVEVRDIAGVHGLDYIAAQHTPSDSRNLAAGGSEIGGRGDPECQVDGEMTVPSGFRQMFVFLLTIACAATLACSKPEPAQSGAPVTAVEAPATPVAAATSPAGAPIIEPPASPDQPTRVLDPRADEILRAMSRLLASTPRYAFEAEEEFDEIPSDQPRISLSNRRRVVVERPNKVVADVEGDSLNRSVWFDGRTFTLLDKNDNTYASVPIAGSIDKALDALDDRYGVSLPLSDLLYADPYAVLTEEVSYSRYLGLHRAAGRLCHHLVFAQPTIEWQMWIDAGDQPWPVKMAIAYVQEPGEPKYEATLGKWTLPAQIPAELFRFEPPDGAERVEPAALVPAVPGATR